MSFLAVFSVSVVVRLRSHLVFTFNFAIARGLVALPSLERHIHSSPLPRLGGVAIFISFAFTMGCAVALALRFHLHAILPPKPEPTILTPAGLVCRLGAYADIRGVSPLIKSALQGVAGTVLFLGGLQIVNIPVLFGRYTLPWFVGLPCTFCGFWPSPMQLT